MNNKNNITTFLDQQREKLKDVKRVSRSREGLENYPISRSQCLYLHDFQSQDIVYQKGVFEFLGYSAEEFNSELVHNFFHPEDKPIVLRVIQASVRYAIEHKLSHDAHLYLTYRVRKKNGSFIKVLRQSSVFETDENGRLISNLSMLSDVSYMNTSNVVEWKFHADELDEKAFKRYIGQQYESIFSTRQLEIIRGIGKGLNSEEIGKELFISKHTVDTHRRNILKQSGCKNSVELITFCKKNGIT
jgi:DNA-binding NarL/FixJ family response regulator